MFAGRPLARTYNDFSFRLQGVAFFQLIVFSDPHPGDSSRGRVLAYGEVEAVLIYDRRIGIVSFWGMDETDRRSEGIYFHRR
jgi:hypothetical protein